jgi:hypothetical protein
LSVKLSIQRRKIRDLVISPLLAALFSIAAEARFLEEDAEYIDEEERLNTETVNDILSYRHPVRWLQAYQKSDVAYRVNASSLTVSRFDLEERIKFASDQDLPYSFAFYQTRQEGMLEERFEQTIRANWRPQFLGGSWLLGLLADGGTLKEFGDLGLSARYELNERQYVELFYWSVDHFFNEKKSFASDRRQDKPFSIGAESQLAFGPIDLFLFYEWDQPFLWQRRSRLYDYAYDRRHGKLGLSLNLTADQRLIFDGHAEHKGERKLFFDADLSRLYEKAMSRYAEWYELRYEQQSGEALKSAGVVFLTRKAKYRFDQFQEVATLLEKPHPEQSRRYEGAVYANQYFGSGQHYFQTGYYYNYVVLKEERDFKEHELKWQWAFEYRYSGRARVLLNFTVDCDQIITDFPFKDNFRPWGGGGIQFMATL